MVGRILGNQYRILEAIGAGGMGLVYLVEHIELKNRFAVKVLNAELADDPAAVMRFELEADAAAELDHANIAHVIDWGQTDDGLVFLVTEHLRGQTLRARLAKPLLLEEIIAIAVEVCAALAAAHRAGIVHGDIKPENIFLIQDGDARPAVKVLDFGISRARDVTIRDAARIAKQEQLLGSPEYKSPEACRGEEVDARADIYAVGVLLYEMFTGRVPFRHESYLKVLQWHTSMMPLPPRDFDASLPEAAERVILRALQKDPVLRHQSIQELELELQAAFPSQVVRRSLATRHTPPPDHSIRMAGMPDTGVLDADDTPLPSPVPARDYLLEVVPREIAPGRMALHPPPLSPPPVLVEQYEASPGRDEPTLQLRRRRTPLVWPIVIVLAAFVVGTPVLLHIKRSRLGTSEKRVPVATMPAADGRMPTSPITRAVVRSSGAPPGGGEVRDVNAADTPPPTVRLRIETSPSRARATLDGLDLGLTPVDSPVPSRSAPGLLELRLAGHYTATRRIALADDAAIEVAMVQRQPLRPRPKRPPAPPPSRSADRPTLPQIQPTNIAIKEER